MHVVAECALDRIALELDGKSVATICFNYIPSMLQSTIWQERYAALSSMSLIAEGCKAVFTEQAESIVNLVIPSYKDPHDRVIYACCKAIGQLASHLEVNIN